jgi:hypothetical protein
MNIEEAQAELVDVNDVRDLVEHLQNATDCESREDLLANIKAARREANGIVRELNRLLKALET